MPPLGNDEGFDGDRCLIYSWFTTNTVNTINVLLNFLLDS